MYIGRFVVVGPETGAYRVSSRSFPNRQVVDRGDKLTVGPTPDAEETDNPYVSYNCVRPGGDGVVLGNGSHVDPIAEKLEMGYPARDALASALFSLDFEKDSYDTPRIAGVIGVDDGPRATVDDDSPGAYVGIVRRDAIIVERVTEPTLVATYEEDRPRPFDFEADDAETAANAAYDLDFEHAVCAAGVDVGDGTVTTAIHNGGETN